MKKLCIISVLLCFGLVSFSCGQDEKAKVEKKESKVMQITSTAFKEGETIPVKYTCDSVDVSPPLEISGVPEGAKSLALICDDPDAPVGTWVHWVVFNIPPDVKTLPEDVEKKVMANISGDSTEVMAVQGMTDFGGFGYGGPCPPKGPAHRYFFKLYALDGMVDFDEKKIKAGVTKKELLEKIEAHVVAEAVLMGKYGR